MYKVCPKCGLNKSVNDYYKGGNNRYCIECTSEYKKERRSRQNYQSKVLDSWGGVPLKVLVGEVLSEEDLQLSFMDLVKKYFPDKL